MKLSALVSEIWKGKVNHKFSLQVLHKKHHQPTIVPEEKGVGQEPSEFLR